MKKVVWGILFLGLVLVSPVPTRAGINIDIGISLPPPIVFASPPQLVVLPETYVYVAPDLDADIFFHNGWWWRPWEGRWYRSHDYNSGWSHYRDVPSFYKGVPPGWRNDYRQHRWKGHKWNHQRIHHKQLKRNWRDWEKNKHWEKQQSWGVKDLPPRHFRPQVKEVKQKRSQVKEVQQKRSQQHRKADTQSRKTGKPQHSKQQKNHDNGKEGKKGK